MSNHATQIKVPGPTKVRINTWNGNLFFPVPILTIPGRGLSIALSLSYNSSWHNVETHYGHGWQLSYNMFYVRDTNGNIIGRSLQLGEGWHSSRHMVRFWHPLVLCQKETAARC